MVWKLDLAMEAARGTLQVRSDRGRRHSKQTASVFLFFFSAVGFC